MGTLIKTFKNATIILLAVTAMLLFGRVTPSFPTDNLQIFHNARLINDPANDGDSFLVKAEGKSFILRLYFVDCPETSISSKSDARRVREQTRYFGLPKEERTIHFGNKAQFFVERILVKNFTVYTSFATAMGRSTKGRVYGFITTSDGNDLATLLVKNGLARAFGVGRKTPDGISKKEMIERLRDLESAAILRRIGVWSQSGPDRIAKLRARERSEGEELKQLQRQVKKDTSEQVILNLNTATSKELQSIKGIGPVIAERIIAGRPYKTVNELRKVKGIGAKRFEEFRAYFVVRK